MSDLAHWYHTSWMDRVSAARCVSDLATPVAMRWPIVPGAEVALILSAVLWWELDILARLLSGSGLSGCSRKVLELVTGARAELLALVTPAGLRLAAQTGETAVRRLYLALPRPTVPLTLTTRDE